MSKKGLKPEYVLDHRLVLQMAARGATTNQIIHRTGFPKTTVNRWIREARCQSK